MYMKTILDNLSDRLIDDLVTAIKAGDKVTARRLAGGATKRELGRVVDRLNGLLSFDEIAEKLK